MKTMIKQTIMKQIIFTFLVVVLAGVGTLNLGAAITVTSPSTGENTAAAEDYATTVFQDPMDMNQQTDLGWFIFDKTSGSKSNLSSIQFSNGIFSASATSRNPLVYILDTALPGTCKLGKIGSNYKINATKYKVLAMRMKLNKNSHGLLFWSKNTIYNDLTQSNAFPTYNGWRYYLLKIPQLGTVKVGSKPMYSWGGNMDSLRLRPALDQVAVSLDWIRLVEDSGALYRTIRWTGSSGTVDIYLDRDRNAGNGNLGKLASGVSGSSYSFHAGALAPGRYYVGIKPSGGGTMVYSKGYYDVNEIPTLEFTSPSVEGGADFASARLGNPWDMNSTADLDGYSNLAGAPSISTIAAQDERGVSLGNLSLLKGANRSGSMDPILFFLWFHNGRGAATPIDADKYRIMVLKMGIDGAWDLNAGSVARVYWHVKGEFNGNVERMHQSADVVVRHKGGSRKTISTIITDMKTLTLEQSQSSTGWKGTVDGFRIDPHEFTGSKNFYVHQVKLAAFDRADASYRFTWNYSDGDPSGSSLALYYDTNKSGYNGTLIKSGIDPLGGEYTWNTAGMPVGTYYIYGVFGDRLNSNRTYARWPIVIDHTVVADPAISLSKSTMTFSSGSGNSGSFTVGNSGGGTLNWTVSDNRSWLSVSPTSGQNSGTVTVTVDRSGLSAGTYSGTVTVSSADAPNSPRTVAVTLEVSGSSGGGGGGGGTPSISVSRTKLTFGAVGGAITGPQRFFVENSGGGTLNWTASENLSWLSLSHRSGTNSGAVTVTASGAGLAPGTYTGTVSMRDSAASNSPVRISITFKVYRNGSGKAPFGQFATPTNGAVLRSSIPVTGWVVDDIDVASVKIYNGADYVGDAVFVEGARPDVESAYPGYPKNYQAGWGYMLLSNFLPNGGNGTYTISARAVDAEGNRVTLGSRTIRVDNANAVKPFGAIDTPSQGGTASGGSYINWGWVLTPQPDRIRKNGSTINVYVDGVKLGNPQYNLTRSDIASFFPGYVNSSGAGGKFVLDTTAYKNGVHTIQWTATDSGGNSAGIGSRFFTVLNTGSNRTASAQGEVLAVAPETLALLPPDSVPVTVKRGFGPGNDLQRDDWQEVYPAEGGAMVIEIKELERVVVSLAGDGRPGENGASSYRGYLKTRDGFRPLPIGSTLDRRGGVFYWGPGPGFVGEYEFLFVDLRRGVSKRLNVVIK